jgi:hypothetical protein
VRGLNISGQATSTSNVGWNITSGCYAVNGACISSGSSGSSFAWPFTAQTWGVSTTTTLGMLNGFLSTASSTIVGNATTTGNEWTIKVPYKASFYKDQSFAKFGNYINMFGEGRPVIEITDSTTVGVADILGISKISGCTLIYKDGVELNIGNGLKIDDCDIFMNNTSYVSPRILTIRSGVVTNCRIFADQIILDSTTGNFVDDCKISVEFTNPQNNDVNTTNKVVSTLANYFDQHSSI